MAHLKARSGLHGRHWQRLQPAQDRLIGSSGADRESVLRKKLSCPLAVGLRTRLLDRLDYATVRFKPSACALVERGGKPSPCC
jgi:hypothetical protein